MALKGSGVPEHPRMPTDDKIAQFNSQQDQNSFSKLLGPLCTLIYKGRKGKEIK